MSVNFVSVLVEIVNGVKVLPEHLFIQWRPVFEFIDRNVKNKNIQSLEWYLKNYEYPDNLPNLTREIDIKNINHDKNFFEYDGFNEFGLFVWVLDFGQEGKFYFNKNEVLLPSGELLRFD